MEFVFIKLRQSAILRFIAVTYTNSIVCFRLGKKKATVATEVQVASNEKTGSKVSLGDAEDKGEDNKAMEGDDQV